VDPGQLEQVIVNLAVNARDAMPDGGRLEIRGENVDLGQGDEPGEGGAGAPCGPCVRLTVTDTGTGMDADTIGRIFEPFFTTKGPGRGTGMGLSTVYGIVEQSGGRIEVRSEPGAGTAFDIYLPRADSAGEDPAPDDTLDPSPDADGPMARVTGAVPADGATVLLVEDEDPVRRGLARLLQSYGYAVLAAASGAEALELMATSARPVDVVVSDIQMPGIQGPELARRLRLVRPDLPVLFMSGYAGTAETDALAQAGGARILEKPFDGQSLARAVRAALGERG